MRHVRRGKRIELDTRMKNFRFKQRSRRDYIMCIGIYNYTYARSRRTIRLCENEASTLIWYYTRIHAFAGIITSVTEPNKSQRVRGTVYNI